MFPAGAPGIALFVLRNCMVVALIRCAFPTGWQHFLFLAFLSMLSIGLLTPAVCALAALAVLAQAVYLGKLPDANVIVVVLSTLSLAFLGPGAFSIDARLFGRRMLVSSSSSI
jgi:hypothetical protein